MGMRGGNTLLRKTSFDASHMMANSQTTERAADPISQSQRLRGGVTDAPIPTEKPIQCSVVPMVWMIVLLDSGFCFRQVGGTTMYRSSPYGTLSYQRKAIFRR